MKNNEINITRSSTGAGYIIGALTGMIAGIVIFIITRDIAVSIPPAVALGIPLGIAINQKLTGEKNEYNPLRVRLVLTVISTGIIFFVAVALLLKFI